MIDNDYMLLKKGHIRNLCLHDEYIVQNRKFFIKIF